MSQEQPKLMSEDDLLRVSSLALVLLKVEAGVSETDDGAVPDAAPVDNHLLGVRRKTALDLHHELGSWFEVPLDPPSIPDYFTVLNNVSVALQRKDTTDAETWLSQSRSLAYMLFLHLCEHEEVRKKREEGEWPEPMTEEDMKQLVKDCIHGMVFTAHNIKPTQFHMATSVFMPLALGAYSSRAKFEWQNIGTFYEYLSEAGPRSVNGLPTFMSVRIINKKDWDRCFKAIIATEAALEDVKL